MQLHPPVPLPSARRSALAVVALSICCIFWGFSFPAMQFALHAFEQAAVPSADLSIPRELALRATFNGWRFLAAAALFAALTIAFGRRATASGARAGALVGSIMAVGMLLQVLGLRYTLPSISAFLTSLAILFAPLAQALLLRRHVTARTWLAVLIALVGVAILSLPDPAAAGTHMLAQRPPIPFLGEMLTILGAIIFTVQILVVDHYGRRCDAGRLTMAALFTTGLLSAALGWAIGGTGCYDRNVLFSLWGRWDFVAPFVTLVVLCSVVALYMMNLFQPRISPAAATVVYCLEPLFAAVFSAAMGTERLTWTTLLGGMVIVTAVLLITRASAAIAAR